MNRDLTVGKPEKVLRQFCLPLFGSIIFQQLYNIADSLIAGRFICENALAASRKIAAFCRDYEILVVDDGEVKERGTHEELMEKRGLYKAFMDKMNSDIAWRKGEKQYE